MLSWARDWPCSGLNVVRTGAYLVMSGACHQEVSPSFDSELPPPLEPESDAEKDGGTSTEMVTIGVSDGKGDKIIKKATGYTFNEIYLQKYFERDPFASSFDPLFIKYQNRKI